MPEVFSPQVITREIDISTVAPSVSSSIAAIVGGAVKGEVNKKTFVTTPNQFVEIFGEPTPESFLGYAAINFLRQGNQLWVTRVASLAGDNPVATANTDTAATITSESYTVFGFSGALVLQIDFDKNVTINFSPTTSSDINTIAATINAKLSESVPKLGTATVNGDKIKITTQSKNGPLSQIVVVDDTTTPAAFAGKSDTGVRTVQTETALTAATISSNQVSSGINTLVTFASVTGDAATLFNVSKQANEAFGILSVDSNTFTAGVYNRLTVTMTAVPTVPAPPASPYTLVINGDTLTFTNSPSSATDVDVTGLEGNTDATSIQTVVSRIADVINKRQSYTSGIPTIGVTAVANGSDLELTQIDPVSTTTVAVSTTAPTGIFDVGGTDLSSGPLNLTGGSDGDYIKITVPSTVTQDADGAPLANTEVNVDYYFLAGEDFNVSPSSTVTQIAASLSDAISLRNSYFPDTFVDASSTTNTAQAYTLDSSVSSNQVTITTGVPLGDDGNDIIVDISNVTAGALGIVDFNGSNLSHGFDSRSTYTPFNVTVDGTLYTFNFDTVPSSILPVKHEATAQQIADAINFLTGENFAVATTSNEVQISSPTSGSEGSVSVNASINFGANNDPFTSPLTSTGSGDNHIKFKVDSTFDVDVFFSQSAALSVFDAVGEINSAAKAVDSSLANVAAVSQSGDRIVLTSPTAGSLAEFGSSIQVINGLSGVFDDLTIKTGTGSKEETITISAATPGSWANDSIEVAFQNEDPLFSAPNSSRVDVFVNGALAETFREVVINPDADGTTGASGQGIFIENAINGVSEFITVDFDDDLLDLDPDTLVTSVKIVQNTSKIGSNPPYKLSGGADGIDGLTDADIIGVSSDPSTGEPTGLQIFRNPETIFINLLAAPGWSSQAVTNELAAIAEERQDTLALIDGPLGLTPEQIVDWHNGQGGLGRTAALNTSYAAVYGTWIKQFDPYNNIDISVPPSAHVLAQFAFSDGVSEPWFATAGLNRGRLVNALDVINNPSLGQRELMYGQGNAVNPIVNFVQDGVVIWGQKTLLRSESALNRINVRRLLNFAKVVISLGTKIILFQPNDETTIERLINIINPVLADIQARRGLQSFKVEDATTARDRNLNRVVLRIFIQPTRTVEVIDIPFIITAEGGSFAI